MHSTIQHHPKKMKRWDDDDKVEKVHNKRTWFVMHAEVRWFSICNFNFKGFHSSFFNSSYCPKTLPFLNDESNKVESRIFLSIRVHSSFYALDLQLAKILMDFILSLLYFLHFDRAYFNERICKRGQRERKSSKKYLDHDTEELFLKIDTNYVI